MRLTLEQQKELAKFEGYSDFDAWLEMDKKRAEKTERELAEAEAYKPTKAEIARKINDLRTNPFAIEYYRRISMNDDLTVEQVIKRLEKTKTSD
ncbi:hypothetical protein [Avibacterium paragallinarum]|uniref:Uncharacterized protein n=1 Tax=Avibacterium paragallinarum TaxID=728 RepID=A0A0F5EUZ4_AVIPA|nr:hypothetical protein [Avibacterium paragallinarum]AZI13553.1 hypothetical protein EIA51_02200 [Avibacterium paragallinarum]POY47412.1 hypothetical protein C3364_02025 [Avibacterium paragallinarum]QIR10874.1 hypothetical protein HBL79_00545 [Avibacterium paragallinarum]QLD63964.1 hypothetical protein VY92_000550 [Avibacterium paragallinarum]RZN56123.1 hypothetical protein EIG78_09610 [Avibacterium paragallinarum]